MNTSSFVAAGGQGSQDLELGQDDVLRGQPTGRTVAAPT